jgi:hypothetical protein
VLGPVAHLGAQRLRLPLVLLALALRGALHGPHGGAALALVHAQHRLPQNLAPPTLHEALLRGRPGVMRALQLEARGTKERARLGWLFFGREIFILKTMMFREEETVSNERELQNAYQVSPRLC